MLIDTKPITTFPKAPTVERRYSPFHKLKPAQVEDSTYRPRRDINFEDCRTLLETELPYLGCERVVLELDLKLAQLRQDGWPRSGQHPGPRIVLSFDSDYGPLRYACDTYTTWTDNLYAIARGLESLRAVDRWGVTTKGEQYTGWKALPPAVDTIDTPEKAIAVILEYAGDWSQEVKQTMADQFLELAPEQQLNWIRMAERVSHPDQGGSDGAFQRVQAAKEVLHA